jgi:hypothetical protein
MRDDFLSLNEPETLGLFVIYPKCWITCFSSPRPCTEEAVLCLSESSRFSDECTATEYQAVGRGRMYSDWTDVEHSFYSQFFTPCRFYYVTL